MIDDDDDSWFMIHDEEVDLDTGYLCVFVSPWAEHWSVEHDCVL